MWNSRSIRRMGNTGAIDMILELLIYFVTVFISYGINNGTFYNSFPDIHKRKHNIVAAICGPFGIISLPLAFWLNGESIEWGFKL